MTTTVTTGEGQVCVFVAIDHCTSECIGIHASLSGNRFEALREFRRTYNDRWLVERHGYRTPSQVRIDLSAASRRLDAGPPCRRVG